MIREYANERGFAYVLDGTNADDVNEYRPGIRALKEFGMKSPLLENGLTKNEIRELSKKLNLPTWNKPSYACLLSRIPYGTELNAEEFEKIEKSEKYLIDKGFAAVRVRCHGDIARIEVPAETMAKLFNVQLMDEISSKLKGFGFQYVSLDMQGYKTGSFDAVIKEKES